MSLINTSQIALRVKSFVSSGLDKIMHPGATFGRLVKVFTSQKTYVIRPETKADAAPNEKLKNKAEQALDALDSNPNSDAQQLTKPTDTSITARKAAPAAATSLNQASQREVAKAWGQNIYDLYSQIQGLNTINFVQNTVHTPL